MSAFSRLVGWFGKSRYFRDLFGFSLRRIFGIDYDILLNNAEYAASNSGRVLPTSVGDDDKVAIHWYTRDDETAGLSYRDLNQFFRSARHSRSVDLTVLATFLNEAIGKFDPRDGLSFRIVNDVPGLPAFEPGTTICENSFLSSSRNPRVPFPGDLYFVVFGKKGRDVGPLSAFDTEDEVLFSPFTSFLIISKELLSDGSTLITMEEME